MQTRTSGGSSETGQKALTVRPRGRSPTSWAVTMATPDGKQAMISLMSCDAMTTGLDAGADGQRSSSHLPHHVQT